MTTIKQSLEFGIEPARITNNDNYQVTTTDSPLTPDPIVYADKLGELVKTMLNSVLTDAQANIPFPIELLPTRNSLPTPLIAHLLTDRSVVVPVRGGAGPKVVTAVAGSEIIVEPIEKAIMVSHVTKLWDHKSFSGFTTGTLQQDALNICENIVRSINSKIVDRLTDSKLLKKVELKVLTGNLREKADLILDAISENTESSLGAEVSSYGIIAHESHLKALQRLAMKDGFGGDDAIKDMMGTDVAYYNGSDRGRFMLAKGFTCLSFGCMFTDGEHISVKVSRQGDTQSNTLEIFGKLFVVAEAATTVKMDTGVEAAVLPVVKCLSFTKTS